MPKSGLPISRIFTLDVAIKTFRVELVRGGIEDNTSLNASSLAGDTWYINTKGQGSSSIDFSISNLSSSANTLLVSYDNGQNWNEFDPGKGYSGPARLYYFTVKAKTGAPPSIRFQVTMVIT